MSVKYVPDRFKDKVLVITGATSGIGRATAVRAGLEGGKVVCVGRNDERGKAVVEEIKANKGEAIFVKGDVCNPEDVAKIFKTVVEVYGKIDVLVNNAGVLQPQMVGIDELPFEVFKSINDANVNSNFLCTQEAAKVMKKQGTGGAIVNLSSVTGITGYKNAAAYVASKHAVTGLTKAAAYDLAEYGIRVNAVCPHMTITPMTAASGPQFAKIMQETGKSIDEVMSDLLGQKIKNLQNRGAKPEEQAASILYLASDDSAHMTGSIVATDNGFTCF